MQIELIRPNILYKKQVMNFQNEMFKNNDVFAGCAELDEVKSFEEWIDFENRQKKKYGEGYVPAEVFLAIRKNDNKLVGVIDYLHSLTNFLLKYGGNIGYSVLPSERKKGYAKEMLKQMLEICKKYGEKKILICCEKENEASRKTILANGGVLENEIANDINYGHGGKIQRYWIVI